MNKIKILIVEDEPKLLKTLEDFLGFQDYLTEKAMTGNEAVAVFKEKKNEIDLVLLDLMLPDISGYTVLKEIRKISEVPVIILSARSAVADQMSGFEKGADDYITKPFSLALVKLHIEAVLKRAGIRRDILVYENLQIDRMSQKIYVKDKIIETKKEFDLLLYFVEHQGVVLDRNKILDAVWEYDYTGDIRTVDTLVKQLRRKIAPYGSYIRSVYGVGYIFEGEENETAEA